MDVKSHNARKESCCNHLVEKAAETDCECVPHLTAGQELFVLFTEGDDLYEAMLASIASAQRSIKLESYIFADDEVGRRFAEALVERVSSGVEVLLFIDAAGSLFWSSRSLERYLREHGVCVKWFHRWSWRKPFRYNRRNHRKLLVVDGEKVYLGGFNIHSENSRAIFGEKRWRDTHVGVSGSLPVEAAELFDAFWEGERDRFPKHISPVSALIPSNTPVCRQPLHCLYMSAFQRAEKSVYLTTPYFVPDHRTQRGLVDTAKRGVDVRLLVPRKNHPQFVQWAARAAYANLLKEGVRIYEYLPRMLHAKTAVVDGVWATIGSANLDYRSFFFAYELNLVTCDSNLCRRLEDQFISDISEAEEVFLRKWTKRPWSHHLAETVVWLARRWL